MPKKSHYAKTWESTLKVEKVHQNFRKYTESWEVWESVSKGNEACQRLRKYVNAYCYWFAVQMLSIFLCPVWKSVAIF